MPHDNCHRFGGQDLRDRDFSNLAHEPKHQARHQNELLSNLVFEDCWSCGDLVLVCGFNSVFKRDASDDFGKVVKAA